MVRVNPEAYAGAKHALAHVLRVERHASLLVLTDEDASTVGWTFYEAARELGLAPCLTIMPPTGEGDGEPPALAAASLAGCDVFVVATSLRSKSMSHTRARRAACAAGARGVTLPGMNEELLSRPAVRADYEAIAAATEALASRLNGTKRVRVRTPAGTDVTFDVEGGVWFAERGLCDIAGGFGNLPGGEVSLAPASADGVLVVDASISVVGKVSTPLTLELAHGRLMGASGEGAEALLSFLRRFGPEAMNVAEIGIGMNPAARISGHVLEDEKVLGTVHVGFGDNSNMGGVPAGTVVSADVHIDGVVAAPVTMEADGVSVDPRTFFCLTE